MTTAHTYDGGELGWGRLEPGSGLGLTEHELATLDEQTLVELLMARTGTDEQGAEFILDVERTHTADGKLPVEADGGQLTW